jgi:hypothetical protein
MTFFISLKIIVCRCDMFLFNGLPENIIFANLQGFYRKQMAIFNK